MSTKSLHAILRQPSEFDVFEMPLHVKNSLVTKQTNLLGQFIMNTPAPTARCCPDQGTSSLPAPWSPSPPVTPTSIQSMCSKTSGSSPAGPLRVLNSMAWMLDSSASRWLVRSCSTAGLKPKASSTTTGELQVVFSDFCQNVAENLAHESLYSGEESSEQTLAILMSLRFQWHDATQGSAHACIPPKDYKPKSLRELVENEKPRQANLGTRSNLQRLAAEEANINYDDAKARYIAVNPAKPERAAEFDEMIKRRPSASTRITGCSVHVFDRWPRTASCSTSH